MIKEITQKIKELSPRKLFFISVITSIVMSCFVSGVMSLFFHGVILYDYLATGFVASFLIATLIVYIIIGFTQELQKEVDLHKETLQNLHEREEEYRLLAESADEIILTLGFDGIITYINQKGLEISGYNPEETIGTNFSRIIPEDKIEYLNLLLEKRSQGYSEQLLYETEFRNKSGLLTPVEVSSNLILKMGKPHGVLVIARDITERKIKERKLEESESKYRTLINTMQEGLIEVDSEWNITFVNDRFSKIIGYEQSELIGSSFFNLISNETREVAEEQHLIRQNGVSSLYELELITSDEKKIFVLCSPNPSYDADGKYIGGFGVISDITKRKAIEAEREKLISDLKEALERIKTLRGLIPICASCKKIRDDQGYWNNLEAYIEKHSDASFSHGLCFDCSNKLYGSEDWFIEMKKDQNKDDP